MKLNRPIFCIKFHQKVKIPKFWTFEVFLGFLKNLVFSQPFSSPGGYGKQSGYSNVEQLQ